MYPVSHDLPWSGLVGFVLNFFSHVFDVLARSMGCVFAAGAGGCENSAEEDENEK
jgi:hypothetical protein